MHTSATSKSAKGKRKARRSSRIRDRSTAEETSGISGKMIAVGDGSVTVDASQVSAVDESSVVALLEQIARPTGSSPIQRITVNKVDGSGITDTYSILAIWEGSKPFTREFVQHLNAYASSCKSAIRLDYTISFDAPPATRLLANAKALVASKVDGEDTHHRLQLLGLKSVLFMNLELGQSHVQPAPPSKKRRRSATEPVFGTSADADGVLSSLLSFVGWN